MTLKESTLLITKTRKWQVHLMKMYENIVFYVESDIFDYEKVGNQHLHLYISIPLVSVVQILCIILMTLYIYHNDKILMSAPNTIFGLNYCCVFHNGSYTFRLWLSSILSSNHILLLLWCWDPLVKPLWNDTTDLCPQ